MANSVKDQQVQMLVLPESFAEKKYNNGDDNNKKEQRQ
jgi:hypothetical protein